MVSLDPPPSGSFSQVLTLQLKELKSSLLTDHERRVRALRTKVTSLENEVEDLHKQLEGSGLELAVAGRDNAKHRSAMRTSLHVEEVEDIVAGEIDPEISDYGGSRDDSLEPVSEASSPRRHQANGNTLCDNLEDPPTHCLECGNIFMADAVFCRKCGARRGEKVLGPRDSVDSEASLKAVVERANTDPNRANLVQAVHNNGPHHPQHAFPFPPNSVTRHEPPEAPVPLLHPVETFGSGVNGGSHATGSAGSPKRNNHNHEHVVSQFAFEEGCTTLSRNNIGNNLAVAVGSHPVGSHHSTPRPSERIGDFGTWSTPRPSERIRDRGNWHETTPRPSGRVSCHSHWHGGYTDSRRSSGSSMVMGRVLSGGGRPHRGEREQHGTFHMPGSRPPSPPDGVIDPRLHNLSFQVPDVSRVSVLSAVSSNGGYGDSDFQPLSVWNDTQWKKSRKMVQLGEGGQDDDHIDKTTSIMSPMMPSMNKDIESEGEFEEDAHSCTVLYMSLVQRFMMQPSSMKHLVWEFIGLALIIYDTVMIPMECFDFETSVLMIMMGWIVRVFWTVDIPHSFLTGIVDKKGGVTMHPIKVAKRFARTWLPLDLLCVVLDWITVSSASGTEYLSLFRVFRLVRMMKLIRLNNSVINNLLEEHIRSEQVMLLTEIVKICFGMLLAAHTSACIWYTIGRTRNKGGPSWIKENHLQDAGLRERYVWSFHWSIALFVGETNYDPMNVEERSFAVSAMFFFYLMSALFVSSMTTKLTRLQIITSAQASQLSALRRYMGDHNISASLSVRVQRNAQYALDALKRNAPESSIEVLDLVSEPLRMELHFELHAPALMGHPFFDNYHFVNPAGIQKLCHVATSQTLVSTGDIVFSNYEVPAWPRMFFIITGKLLYMQPPMIVTPMHVGQWAAEASLWTSWIHSGTMRAAEETTILQIDAQEFAKIVSPFPTNHAHKYAVSFVSLLNRSAEQGIRSDLRIDEQEDIIPKVFPEMYDDHDHYIKGKKRGSKERLSQTLKRNKTAGKAVLERAKTHVGKLLDG